MPWKATAIVLFAFTLILTSSTSTPGYARSLPASEATIIFITLPDRFTAEDEATVTRLGGVLRHVFRSSPTVSATIPAAAVTSLFDNPRFLAVRPVPVVSALEDAVPWGIGRVRADATWGAGPGAVDVAPGAPAGAGVTVAVIDTGIDSDHPDLAGNLVGGRNYVPSGQTCFFGFCFGGSVNPDAWDDNNGHGTHVAGTIAALDNGSGVIGAAPVASLYAIKVLDGSGSGTLDDVIAGIEHATAIGADVVNMSLGCACDDPALQAAVDEAFSSGVVVVAAAGNEGPGADTVIYPAHYDAVIAVAATCGPTSTSYCSAPDTRASFSSTGSTVELAAPGDAINSTVPGGYGSKSGTSMASPHVAGVVALLRGCDSGMGNAQARAILRDTAYDLGAAGRDSDFGYGLVVADAAVEAAGCIPGGGPDESPPETTITSAPADPTNSTGATFSFASSEPGSSFACELDGAGFSDCVSPKTYSALGEGTHTFRVRATDGEGNTDPSPAEAQWTIDLSPPETIISSGPPSPSGSDVATFEFSSNEGGSSFQCRLDSGAIQACTSPRTYSGLAGGEHTFEVRAVDPAGNVDASPASYSWTIDLPANPALHVGDLDGTATATSFIRWSASVTVTVHDAAHAGVAGATVTAQWSGAASATVSGVTGAGGSVTFTRTGLTRFFGASTITLTVSNVEKAGYTYDASLNHDPETDSNGTAITLSRP